MTGVCEEMKVGPGHGELLQEILKFCIGTSSRASVAVHSFTEFLDNHRSMAWEQAFGANPELRALMALFYPLFSSWHPEICDFVNATTGGYCVTKGYESQHLVAATMAQRVKSAGWHHKCQPIKSSNLFRCAMSAPFSGHFLRIAGCLPESLWKKLWGRLLQPGWGKFNWRRTSFPENVSFPNSSMQPN